MYADMQNVSRCMQCLHHLNYYSIEVSVNLILQTTRLPTPDVWLNKSLTIEALIEEDSQNFNCSVFISFKHSIFVTSSINTE